MNNQVTLFTTITVAFFIPYLVIVGNYYFLPIEVGVTALIAFAFVLNRYGFLWLSMLWRYMIVAIAVTYASLEMPLAGFEYFLIPLAIIPFILSYNTTTQVVLFSLSLLLFFMRKYLSHDFVPHSQLSRGQNLFTYITVLSMVFVLCSLFVIKYKLAGIKYEGVINAQLKEIEEQKKDILDSINYARRLQLALLPPEEEMAKAFGDYFVLYKPKDIVSGDFYWFERYQDKLFVAVADCTGHGVPGAMMSVLCTNTLTRVVKELGITSPSLILDKVAMLLEGQLSKTSASVMDGMDIALCCINPAERSLEFAGAYNPLYCIRNGELTELKGNKQPVAKMDNRKPYSNHRLALNKGDCFYLVSDGFCDQFGGPEGKKFSSRRLKENLVKHQHTPMKYQKERLEESLEQWQAGLGQVDDVCILGFRV